MIAAAMVLAHIGAALRISGAASVSLRSADEPLAALRA